MSWMVNSHTVFEISYNNIALSNGFSKHFPEMLPFPKRGEGYIIAAYLRCTCKCTKTSRKMCINTMKVFHIYMFQNKHASICICWLDQDGKILNFFSIILPVYVAILYTCQWFGSQPVTVVILSFRVLWLNLNIFCWDIKWIA